MLAAQRLAGYSLGQADILRKAMGKKDPEVMRNEEGRFVEGAVAHGLRREVAQETFQQIAKFAGYGFNRAHAVGYALVAYVAGWLKTHFPLHFPGLAADRAAALRRQGRAHRPLPRRRRGPRHPHPSAGCAAERRRSDRGGKGCPLRAGRGQTGGKPHRDGHRSGAAGVRRFRVPRPFPRIGGFPGPEPGRGGGAGLRRRARFRRRLAGPDPGSDSRRHRSGREGPRSAGGGGSDPCSAARTSGRRMCSARRRTGPRRNGCGGSARRSASTGRAIRQPNSAPGSGKS